jgi:hypothetical protein
MGSSFLQSLNCFHPDAEIDAALEQRTDCKLIIANKLG